MAQSLDEQINTVERALGECMIEHALVVVRTWLNELGEGNHFEEAFRAIETQYQRIFQLWLTSDEESNDIALNKLTGDTYQLVDAVYVEIRLKRGLSPRMHGFNPESPQSLIQYFSNCVQLQQQDFDWLREAMRDEARVGMALVAITALVRNMRECFSLDGILTLIDGFDAENDIVADMIHDFIPIARALVGLSNLKIISFGPRPSNFLACNAPIQGLYDLHVEIEENSELDLLESFEKHDGDPRIPEVIQEMSDELGAGNLMPGVLAKLAQYELTLLDWIRTHKGDRKYVALTSKCWPAFQTKFGFVPCYVNSRLAAKGYPVACEVDIYGALSEFIGTCISQDVVTLLDINNSVPQDMFDECIKGKQFLCNEYETKDLFMGFHCGNTAVCKLNGHKMCCQRIMARSLPAEITQGTVEGDLMPGKTTVYRLQSSADCKLMAYIAQGEILPVATRSFGSTGVFAIKEMNRFYRHVLIGQGYPHHAAILFDHYGKYLFEVFKYAGIPVERISHNKVKGEYYPEENPFLSEK